MTTKAVSKSLSDIILEMETVQTKRRQKPRYRRQPPSGGGIQIGERELELVQQVFKKRFLTSRHLIDLTKDRYSPKTTLTRLRLLYDEEYLELPLDPDETPYFVPALNAPKIYGLGNKGADLLHEKLGIARGRLDWRQKNRVGRVYVTHTLMASDVLVSLELAARARGNIRVIDLEEILERNAPPKTREDPTRWRVDLDYDGEQQEFHLTPDGIFGLDFLDEGKAVYFFLECDRSTEDIIPKNFKLWKTSVFRTLLAYFETWKEELHTERFGIENMRVLFVAKSPERVSNMIAAQKRFGGGHGYRIFHFADKPSLDKSNPLDFKWVNGRGGLECLTD